MFFRKLTSDEERKFRARARDNYRRGSAIDGAWHPAVQRECALMNEEHAIFVADRDREVES